jgi:hypothetical protein
MNPSIKATWFMMQLRFCRVRGFLLLLCVVAATISSAQTIYKPVSPRKEPLLPKNLKVISEESDGKGNIIRVIQYDQGMMRVTETTIMPKVLPIGASVRISPDTMIKDLVRLVVNKSKHCLMVYYRQRMIRAYKATFGPNPMQDKCMEGDRCTPEGEFKITNINPKSKFNKFMLISYPNEAAFAKFNKLKAAKVIPSSARIGGDIGIHGIWPGGDDMIELGVGWTDGCVALKNKDIEELSSMVGVGTKVVIVKEPATGSPTAQL